MIIGSNYHVSKIAWDPQIKLGNNTLDKVKSTKSLGVYISDTLSWSEYTDFVAKKVSNAIGGLKRMRPYGPIKTLETIYKSLIRPHFDYCDIVWSNLNVSQSLRLQKLQNRAARVILSANYEARSVDLSESLQWDNLSQRRDKHMALLMCKTLQNKTPKYLRNMFSFANTGSGYDTRQRERKLALPKPRTDYLKKSFQYRGSRLCLGCLSLCLSLSTRSELGRLPIQITLVKKSLKYYFYLCGKDQNTIVKQAFLISTILI